MNRFKRTLKSINNFLVIPCGIILTAMTLVVFYDVFARYVFHKPLEWGMEITTYMMLFIVFLGLGYTYQVDGHIRVDILFGVLSKKAQRALYIVGSVLTLVYVGIFIWKTGALAWEAYVDGLYSWTATKIYLFPVYIWMPIGGVLFFLTIISKLDDYIYPLRETNREQE